MAEKQDLTRLLAANIAARRKGAGMTQAELAERLGYSDKTVSKWERGEGIPDVFCLKRMAETFGVRMDDLFADPTAPEKETVTTTAMDVTSPDTTAMDATSPDTTTPDTNSDTIHFEKTTLPGAAVAVDTNTAPVNHGAVAAIAIIGVWMLAALVFLIGHFCGEDLSLSWGIAVPVTGLLMVIFNGLWGERKFTFWVCSFFVVGLLFLVCLLLRRYHIWMLMWLSVPAVVIVWLSCRIGKRK